VTLSTERGLCGATIERKWMCLSIKYESTSVKYETSASKIPWWDL